MGSLRIYAATTGECVGGDQRGQSAEERNRVKQDFASGVRFVLDEKRGEIRCFHPVVLGSKQAFYLVYKGGQKLSVSEMVSEAQLLFEDSSTWGIQPEVATGPLFNGVSENTHVAVDENVPRAKVGAETQFGVQNYETARGLVRRVRSHYDRPGVFIIGTSLQVQDLQYEVFIHVSDRYNAISRIETSE